MVTNGNVTGLVERLASEGMVERAPAPDDRRIQMVSLTSRGKEKLCKHGGKPQSLDPGYDGATYCQRIEQFI